MTRRWLLILSLSLAAAAWFISRRPRDLPQISIDSFVPAVREQVREAYEAARGSPRSSRASGKLGMILHAYQAHEAAAACYERAWQLSWWSSDWPYYLGLVQAAQGKNEEATASFRWVVRLKPGYFPAQLKLAESLLAAGHQQEAEKTYEALAHKYPGEPWAHYGLGRARAARGELTGAVESYLTAIESFPEFKAAHYALAMAYNRLGETAKSQEHFRLYQRVSSVQPPLNDTLLAAIHDLDVSFVNYANKGHQLAMAGRVVEAIAAYEQALKIKPDYVLSHVNLISAYGTLRWTAKAEEHYQAVLSLDPNQAEAHYNFGVVLFNDLRYKEAEEAFKRALEVDPTYPDAHFALGHLNEKKSRWEEAQRHYELAVENKPDYAEARFHLGRVLVQRKLYQKALEQLSKTLTTEGASNPEVLETLASAYAGAGDLQNALSYARQARQEAAAHGQRDLQEQMDTQIRGLEKKEARR